jgi:hypothetical protein
MSSRWSYLCSTTGALVWPKAASLLGSPKWWAGRCCARSTGRETHTTHTTTTHCTLHTCRVLLMLPVVLNVRWTGRWSLRLTSQCIVTVTAQEGQLHWYLSAPHPTLGCMRQCCASVGERYFDQRARVPVRVSLGQCHNGCEWPCMIVTQSLCTGICW